MLLLRNSCAIRSCESSMTVGRTWFRVPEAALFRFVVRVTTARAATYGNEPEQCSGDQKERRDPYDCESTCTNSDFDAKWTEECVEGGG
jgi:hypothetical protein